MKDENVYVTYKDLGDKLDEVYDAVGEVRAELGGPGGVRERITRLETWIKVSAPVILAAAAFGSDLARAVT